MQGYMKVRDSGIGKVSNKKYLHLRIKGYILYTQILSVMCLMHRIIMGWSRDPGPTDLAGRLPAVFVTIDL